MGDLSYASSGSSDDSSDILASGKRKATRDHLENIPMILSINQNYDTAAKNIEVRTCGGGITAIS